MSRNEIGDNEIIMQSEKNIQLEVNSTNKKKCAQDNDKKFMNTEGFSFKDNPNLLKLNTPDPVEDKSLSRKNYDHQKRYEANVSVVNICESIDSLDIQKDEVTNDDSDENFYSHYMNLVDEGKINSSDYKIKKNKKENKNHSSRSEQTCITPRDNRFDQICNLPNVKLPHTARKSHVCEYCGKGFNQLSVLTQHRRTHTGNKMRLFCDYCNKEFFNKFKLMNHKRVHTSEEQYVCNLCGKQFIGIEAFIYHKQNQGDEKIYTCQVCKEKFNKICLLTVHEQIHDKI